MRPVIAIACASCIALLLLGGAASAASAYDDVPTTHWAYVVLDYLQQAGALEAYPEDYFVPATAPWKSRGALTRYEFAQATARLIDAVESKNQGDNDVQIRCLVRGLYAEFADQFSDYGNFPQEPAQPSRIFYHFNGDYDKVSLGHWAYSVLADFQQRGMSTLFVAGYFDGKQERTAYDFKHTVEAMLDNLPLMEQAEPLTACMLEGLRAEFSISANYGLTQEQLDERAVAEESSGQTPYDPHLAMDVPNAAPPREVAAAMVDDGSLRYRLSVIWNAGIKCYDFVLTVTNMSNQPVTFDYATHERYDFKVIINYWPVWNQSITHSFVQKPLSEQLGPYQGVSFRGQWNGSKYYDPPFYYVTPTFSVWAVHSSTSHPMSLQIDGVPNMFVQQTDASATAQAAAQAHHTAYDDVPREHWAYGALQAL